MRNKPLSLPLFFFLATTALYWFSMYTYPMLLTGFVRQELGASPALAGTIVSSYGLWQMLLRIPLGYASDKLRRRKPFLTLGAALSTLAALGLFLARSPAWALVARSVAGLAAAAWVAFTVLYAGYGAREGGARAMGTLSACMYAAQLLGTLVGSAVAQGNGTRSAFMLAVGTGLIGMVCSRFVTDVAVTTQPPSTRALLEAGKNRLLLTSAGLTILLQIIMWATLYGFSPQWATEVLHVEQASLGLLSTVHLLPNILFSWLVGAYLIPRLGEKWVCALSFVCMAVSCLCMPLTRTFVQMLALQALCGVGVGCCAPTLLALSIRQIPSERRGIAMGFYQSLYGVGMFAGPALAGLLIEASSPIVEGVAQLVQGYRINYWACGGVGLLAALLTLVLLPRAMGKTQSLGRP